MGLYYIMINFNVLGKRRLTDRILHLRYRRMMSLVAMEGTTCRA